MKEQRISFEATWQLRSHTPRMHGRWKNAHPCRNDVNHKTESCPLRKTENQIFRNREDRCDARHHLGSVEIAKTGFVRHSAFPHLHPSAIYAVAKHHIYFHPILYPPVAALSSSDDDDLSLTPNGSLYTERVLAPNTALRSPS